MCALTKQVADHYAYDDGTRIHYVTLGEGPPVLMMHGFPDFWYSWNRQMPALSKHFTCAAMDLRGYNLSDQPKGVEQYDLPLLLGDVAAVMDDLGHERVNLVGHDWGGIIAWYFAMRYPKRVKNLIILNLTHPRGFTRTLANMTDAQRRNTEYARSLQRPGSHLDYNAEVLTYGCAREPGPLKALYLEAFDQSDIEAMTNYYKANYWREPYVEETDLPPVQCPVLQFHGLLDPSVDHEGLNRTWEWIKRDYTLVTVPNAGHWVHHDAADLVTDTMKWWLLARQ